MRFLDIFWLTRPEFTYQALPTLWDIATILALGGIWLWFFAVQLKQQPLLPLGEPKLAEAIANHEHLENQQRPRYRRRSVQRHLDLRSARHPCRHRREAIDLSRAHHSDGAVDLCPGSESLNRH